MKLSWEWKLRLINGLCQGYFMVFSALTIIVGFGITLPFLHAEDPQQLFNIKLFTLFIFFNMVINYILIRYTACHSLYKVSKRKMNGIISEVSNFTSYASNSSNTLLANTNLNSTTESYCQQRLNGEDRIHMNIAGWTYCKDCSDFVPPRAKHCPICDACILKRDHHCFFAGCCVGFHNQRYFAIFCMYAAIGGFCSSLITHHYLWYHYEGLQTWGIVAYFIPSLMWFWIVGSVSGSVFIMCLFLYWNFLTALICFFYFGMQVYLILRGQTKYECVKGIHSYKGNFWLNIKSVFGRQWFISVLVPMPFQEYYGDGKNWDDFLIHKLL